MTLKSQITSDVADVFMNTDDFADSVILIRKSTGERAPITAVVAFRESSIEKGRGRGKHTMADMVLPSSVSIGDDDAIEVNGERFEVVAVTPDEFGAHNVTLSQYKSKRRGGRTAGDI